MYRIHYSVHKRTAEEDYFSYVYDGSGFLEAPSLAELKEKIDSNIQDWIYQNLDIVSKMSTSQVDHFICSMGNNELDRKK